MKITKIIIVIGIILNSCEKKPFDYRNKYIGDYQIHTKRTMEYSINSYKDTIYSVLFNCNVKLGSLPNEVDMFINDSENIENNKISVRIMNNGVFSETSVTGFIKENIIELSLSFQAQGGGTQTTYTGIKK